MTTKLAVLLAATLALGSAAPRRTVVRGLVIPSFDSSCLTPGKAAKLVARTITA
jgi:hypothetical protein